MVNEGRCFDLLDLDDSEQMITSVSSSSGSSLRLLASFRLWLADSVGLYFGADLDDTDKDDDDVALDDDIECGELVADCGASEAWLETIKDGA